LAIALAGEADRYTGRCRASYGDLALSMGVRSKRTVLRAVHELVEWELISVERDPGEPYRFALNVPLIVGGGDSESPGVVTESHKGRDSESPHKESLDKNRSRRGPAATKPPARLGSVDDDGKSTVISDACHILARRDLARRVAEKGPVANPEAWVRKVARNREARHRANDAVTIERGLAELVTDVQLADMLDPPPRSIYEKVERGCEHCINGWVEVTVVGERAPRMAFCPNCSAGSKARHPSASQP